MVAKYLNVKERQTQVFTVTALPYSLKSVKVIEQMLRDKGLDALKTIDHKQLESNCDSVIVCKCLVKENEFYVALILDTEDFYRSSKLLKLIKL